ncbi:DUF6270 domain-containing protein [Lactococcus formosensis]|uniref:DUF6270 domain-containing protein n=1 Tax=Lactococcus formosensis TaxID=1281486 RepID=UPI002435C948|nr:DUF6270 domain-containing protein [Lactococcus formosensis]MDG6154952.1 DUF6270 domain-containing protein [Lactococcus formosensis]
MDKLAIFGSCISRDNFNTRFNKNYKEFFEVGVFRNQTSILSIMSEKVNITDNGLKSDGEKQALNIEAKKDFLYKIHEEQPEYLILDFFADTYYGCIELGEDVFFTNNTKYFHLEQFKEMKKFTPYNNLDDYMLIWETKTKDFLKEIKEIVPDITIVIVNVKFSDIFADGTSLTDIRKKSNIPVFDIEILNSIYAKQIEYVESNFDVESIDLTHKNYLLDKNHPWGSFYVHFEKEFYNDFLAKLLKVHINKLTRESNKIIQKNIENSKLIEQLNIRCKNLQDKCLINQEKIKELESETNIARIKRKLKQKYV